MGYREHTAEFLKAVRGGRGELDAWLEVNNESECRAAILGALEEHVASERSRISHLWAGCTTEAEGHGLVDIGLSIREGRLVDAL